MPGIIGCVRLSAADAISPDFSEKAIPLLGKEKSYARRVVVAMPDAHAAVIGPSLQEPVIGAAHDPETGIRIGYYGEFYLPPLRELAGDPLAKALLDLYRKHGDRLPHVLDGSFVVFVWDPARGRALLFNDHAGSRPICYCQQRGYLYFSPEPKGIARMTGVDVKFDETAFVTFLSFGCLLDHQTFYKEIRTLSPGSVIRADGHATTVERSYTYLPCDETAKDEGLDTYVEGLRQALIESCRKRLLRLPRSVIPISGGYDSRGILACMAQLSGSQLTTVSWGTSENVPGADAYIGRLVAQRFGTRHLFLKRESAALPSEIAEMVERVDGATTDPAEHHHELNIIRAIRSQTGAEYLLRGDEIFGTRAGWFLGSTSSDKEALATIGIREAADYPNLLRLLRPDLRPEAAARSRQLLEQVTAECPLRGYAARKDFFYFTQRICNYLHRATYFKLAVLDVTNPWLDKTILDFYRTIPVKYRVQKILYRRTLETMFPEIMQIPIATKTSLERWDRVLATDSNLQQFVRLHLLEKRNALHELLDPAELEKIVRAAVEGASGPPATLRSIGILKEAFARVAPGLYRTVKSSVLKRTHLGFIPPHTMTFRLLVLKLWFDICA